MPLLLSPPAAEVDISAPAPALALAFRLAPPSAIVNISAPAPTLRIAGHVYTPPGPGNPAYPWVLFRGQVLAPSMTREGPLLRIVFDCEDYNRLPPLFKVGAPQFGAFLHQPDPPPLGTDVAVGAPATVGAEARSAVFINFWQEVWTGTTGAQPGPVLNYTNRVDTIGPSGALLPEWNTSRADLKAMSDSTASLMGPYVRWHIDPDLNLMLRSLAGSGDLPLNPEPAPFSFDEDTYGVTGVLLPMTLEIDWDFVPERYRIFVNGGTPEASFWVTNPHAVALLAGEEYIDAPGALTHADAVAVALAAFANRFRAMLRAAPIHVESGHDGWRVGQTTWITSARFSTIRRPVAAFPVTIQSVKGVFISGPLIIVIDGVDVSAKATVTSLTFAESLDGPAKATITLEFPDPNETFDVNDLADMSISTDGSAAIEYDLTIGDITAGDIAKAFAKPPPPSEIVAPKPVYRFLVTINDPIYPWASVLGAENGTLVIAQLADGGKKPVALAGLTFEWQLLQWADQDKTIPGDGLTLDDATGTTDSTGLAFTYLRGTWGATTSVAYDVYALALPIA